MTPITMTPITWKKASLSAHNGGCVEIGTGLPGGAVAMRDSKRRGDGAHVLTRPQFAALASDIRTAACSR